MSYGESARRVRSFVSNYFIQSAILKSYHLSKEQHKMLMKVPIDPFYHDYIRAYKHVKEFKAIKDALSDSEHEFLMVKMKNHGRPRWWEGYYSTSTYYRMMNRIDIVLCKWSGKE